MSLPGDPSILSTSVGKPNTRWAWRRRIRKLIFLLQYYMDERLTSEVEAHQVSATVIMSPQGFNGSPYLPGNQVWLYHWLIIVNKTRGTSPFLWLFLLVFWGKFPLKIAIGGAGVVPSSNGQILWNWFLKPSLTKARVFKRRVGDNKVEQWKGASLLDNLWVRFPRTGILAKMCHFFEKSRAFVWTNLIIFV